ncbi:GntR family transcriptional regulator [Rubripirellula amarantea]|nr:GntR family transcriptional regulator [Rubripirellula amarantea]
MSPREYAASQRYSVAKIQRRKDTASQTYSVANTLCHDLPKSYTDFKNDAVEDLYRKKLDTAPTIAYCTTYRSTVVRLVLLKIQIITGGKVPIYRQIVDQIRSSIGARSLDVGDPLPSVRSLATELVVNPNTVAKAYSALVQDGVIESQQGRGYFVAQRREIYTKKERNRRLEEAIGPFLAEAVTLGFDENEIVSEIRKHFQKLAQR